MSVAYANRECVTLLESLSLGQLELVLNAAARFIPYSVDSPNGVDLRNKLALFLKMYQKDLVASVVDNIEEFIKDLNQYTEAKRPARPWDRAYLRSRENFNYAFEQALQTGYSSNNRGHVSIDKRTAEQFAVNSSGRLIEDFSSAEQKRLAHIIRKAIDEGTPIEKVASLIMDSVEGDEMTDSRAMGIAVTEINMALSQGARAAAISEGATAKRWIDVHDKRECASCRQNARKGFIGIHEEWPDGSLVTPAHPRCRCFVVYRYPRVSSQFDKKRGVYSRVWKG